MKNIYLLLIAGFTLFASPTFAQEATKTVFVELGGNGLIFSANYDMRFGDKINGLGARLGLGYVGGGSAGATVVTVPAMINYLLGKDGKYFEVGAGITYISAGTDFIDDGFSDSSLLGAMTFMYRSQPVNGGFMWKIGFTPILAEGIFIPYWVGLGIGYAF